MDNTTHQLPLSRMESGLSTPTPPQPSSSSPPSSSTAIAITIAQKVLAEVVGTYIVIFAGCGSVVANKLYDGAITFPGICLTWGLTVMAMVYTVGHVSGAHFNPAVTLTQAVFRRFPWKEVPWYVMAQVVGSLLASLTLDTMFHTDQQSYFGTLPSGSQAQTLAIEIITSFILMFVILGATTDDRSIGEFGGFAVGMTVALDVFVAGQVSGASMNPARSIGPAIVKHQFRALWTYIVGPILGMVVAGVVYSLIRYESRPFGEYCTHKNAKQNECREN